MNQCDNGLAGSAAMLLEKQLTLAKLLHAQQQTGLSASLATIENSQFN